MVRYTCCNFMFLLSVLWYSRRYFPGSVHLSVPGRIHPVREVFLEDILTTINYCTPQMKSAVGRKAKSGGAVASSSRGEIVAADIAAKDVPEAADLEGRSDWCKLVEESDEEDDIVIELDGEARSEVDQVLSDVFLEGTQDSVDRLMAVYFGDEGAYVPIDNQVRAI